MLEKLIGLAIFVLPLLLALLLARRYNFIFALFSFFFFGEVIVVVSQHVSKVNSLLGQSFVFGGDFTFLDVYAKGIGWINHFPMKLVSKVNFLNNYSEWVLLALWVILFIILFAISVGIRRARRRRMWNRYSNLTVEHPRY